MLCIVMCIDFPSTGESFQLFEVFLVEIMIRKAL